MAKYRSHGSALAKRFERSTSLIYGVSQDGTIEFANPACEAWVGVEPGSLFGCRLQYSSLDSPNEAPSSARWNVLAPPPDVFTDRESADPIRFLLCGHPVGDLLTLRYRWAVAFPMVESESDEPVVLIISQPNDLPDKPIDSPAQSPAHQLHLALMEIRQQSQLAHRLDSLVGVSPFSARLRRQATLAANSEIDVFICGPSGSGKEHLARTIHANGRQAMFGDVFPIRGTMADVALIQSIVAEIKKRKQLSQRQKESAPASINLASADLLLIIDVDQLSEAAQLELYKLLTSGVSLCRVISTGQRSLVQLAAEGAFHCELANYLSAMTISLIPLWQRVEDVPMMAQAMLERANRKTKPAGFDAAALQLFTEYRWPGNLDQLADVVSQAGEQAIDRKLNPDDLPQKFHDSLNAQRMAPAAESTIDLDQFLASIEQELVLRAIGQAKGNKSKAAILLGLSRAKLLRRIEALGLDQVIEQLLPYESEPLNSGNMEQETKMESRSVASRSQRKTSRLRDKLTKKFPVEEISLESDRDSKRPTAEDDDWNDEGWITPDAFEEIE
jgi:DNA-binding NtrC family response regulator